VTVIGQFLTLIATSIQLLLIVDHALSSMRLAGKLPEFLCEVKNDQ